MAGWIVLSAALPDHQHRINLLSGKTPSENNFFFFYTRGSKQCLAQRLYCRKDSPAFPEPYQRDDGTLSSSHLNARHCVFPCPRLRLHRRTLSEGACTRGLPACRHRGGQIYARRLCGRGACEPALRNRRDAPHVRRGPSFLDEGPLVGQEHRSPGSRASDGDCDAPRRPLRALVLRPLMG